MTPRHDRCTSTRSNDGDEPSKENTPMNCIVLVELESETLADIVGGEGEVIIPLDSALDFAFSCADRGGHFSLSNGLFCDTSSGDDWAPGE